MTAHAFIFARGGSKGLPGKNIKKLAGKPLIQYSIETANRVSQIENIFVSTDDPEIAEVAHSLGVIVIDRPVELAADDTPEWLAWRHAIEWVGSHHGPFEEFVSLPATSPLRATEDVESAIRKRRFSKADVCIGVTPANRSPFFNMVTLNQGGFAELISSSSEPIHRRQDAPDVYDITTVVYVSNPQFIRNNIGLFSGSVATVKVPKERAVDIDDIYDFMLCEAILRASVQ